MPIFYFNLLEGEARFADTEGSDLPDLHAAIEEARQVAREIAANQLRAGDPVDGHKIEVADSDGNILKTMLVRDVLG